MEFLYSSRRIFKKNTVAIRSQKELAFIDKQQGWEIVGRLFLVTS